MHDAVRGRHAIRCDLLVVPKLHHFNTADRPVGPHRLDPGHAHPDAASRGSGPAGQAGLRHRRLGRCPRSSAAGAGAVALAVRSEGGPGVIFRQPRVGRDGAAVRRPQVPVDAPGGPERVRHQLVHRERQPGRPRRSVHAHDLAGRAAAAVEHPPRGHDPGRPASGATALRGAVLARLRPPTRTGTGSRSGSPGWRRSAACAGTPRSPTGPATTTTTSRTGPSGSTSRSSCAPSPRSRSPRAADPPQSRRDLHSGPHQQPDGGHCADLGAGWGEFSGSAPHGSAR